MNIRVRESPLPPSTMDIFLFFCNQEEQFQFIDYLDDFQGMGLLDKGTLDKEDKQECSIHGRGSHATCFILLQMQKPKFGEITLPEGANSIGLREIAEFMDSLSRGEVL